MSSWEKLFNDQLQATQMQRDRADLVEFRLHDAQTILREVLAWLENAPIDYSNGVEHYGLDEGRVRGDKIHDALVAKIKHVLERVSS